VGRREVSAPTFSIVIPTYNRASFISATIESVLAQTFGDFELIVVDDGSSDGTDEIVKSIADPRVSYHYKENEERAVARNTGTSLSSGRYITFFDSDDVLYENHLAIALELIERYNEPECFHLGYEVKDAVSGDSQEVNTLPSTANNSLLTGNHLSCNGVFLRSDIAESFPFNPDRALSGTEDYELWLRLASRFPFYCDNRVTSIIVQHDSRSVLNADQSKLENRIKLLEKYLEQDEAFLRRYGDKLNIFKANNRVYIALHLALSKTDRTGAVKYLFQALRQSPDALKARGFYGTIKRLYL
jgi:glycosyltransferase involved in cell wall biosynthesis